jgi:hypothetical protein
MPSNPSVTSLADGFLILGDRAVPTGPRKPQRQPELVTKRARADLRPVAANEELERQNAEWDELHALNKKRRAAEAARKAKASATRAEKPVGITKPIEQQPKKAAPAKRTKSSAAAKKETIARSAPARRPLIPRVPR